MDQQEQPQQEQLRFLHEIFDPSSPRLGPGDDASTRRALDLLLPESERRALPGDRGLRAIDIGCGNGASTIQLAKLLAGAEIIAVDNHQPYLDELKRRAEAEGVAERIRPRLQDMAELRADEPPFDLIWSEGALYILGFADGLALCHTLLAPGGSMAVSELCWLRPDPPDEISSFFAREYPPMTDVDTNLAIIRDRGFHIVDHFTLPESAWATSYYAPVEARLDSLRPRHAADSAYMEMIELIQEEIDLYRRYSSYYGYVFYLLRR